MHLFIINPAAGNGKGAFYWRLIEKKLKDKEITFKAIMSSSERSTHQLIDHFINKYDVKMIGAIGGDGTIHSVLQKAKRYQIPLAIFPTGSGNDTARMFQLTNSPKIFVENIMNYEVKQIDLLEVNGHYGMTVVGTGLDAIIGKTVNKSFYKSLLGKFKLSSLAYLIAIFQAVMYFKPFKATITIDEKTEILDRAWLIACGNTSSYGGGLKICPNANPTDGKLDVTIFHTLPKIRAMLRIFPTLLSGKPVEKKGVTYHVVDRIQIETDRPIDVILDGEIIAKTPLTIRVHKKALSLLMT